MEVLTSAEMAKADLLTIESGMTCFELMVNAGRAVAEVAEDLVEEGEVLVVAGRGNNGGDGFVAAAELLARGRDVRVMLLCHRDTLEGDAAQAAALWKGPIEPMSPEGIGQPALIIDAIFGTGLDRPLKGDPLLIVQAINHAQVPVLSVDLPTGIHGTTGAVLGDAVYATETVTFFRPKTGHLLVPGRAHCGRLRVADIGISPDVLTEIRPMTVQNSPDVWGQFFPVPRTSSHKYARGHAAVVSGEVFSTGAARLSARAALRACAGVVTVASPRDALMVNAAALTAVMVRPVDTVQEFTAFLHSAKVKACVLGPGAGVGKKTRDFAHAILASGCAAVFDADALTSFAPNPSELFDGIAQAPDSPVVLTPHEGEFPRIFSDMTMKASFRSKLDRVREAAKRSGAVTLLKGADTVIASPDGRAAISVNAPPWLATAGSGDVLAGIISGIMASGVPAYEAACIGVWMHAEAGAEAGPGLIAEDLPEVLPAVTRRLYDHLGVNY